jgi:hypothetical protein
MTRAERDRRYHQSDKGRAAQARAMERYRQTDKGRATQQRYRQTDKGRAANERYEWGVDREGRTLVSGPLGGSRAKRRRELELAGLAAQRAELG